MAETKRLQEVARMFRALGDETRLDIIACLAEGEECVCNLTDALETGQSRLSFHLKTLKDAGIVRDRREGRWVYYSLNPEVMEEIRRTLGSLVAEPHASRVARPCCE